jgi:hypothetical protein
MGPRAILAPINALAGLQIILKTGKIALWLKPAKGKF